jgi:hypothetical protein
MRAPPASAPARPCGPCSRASLRPASCSPSRASSHIRPRRTRSSGRRRPGKPRGIERITRHPFFVGTALLGVGHALLASRLTGVVFFGGLAIFALAGAWHQDRKLLATRGATHAALMARTSLVPFAAIATGRQRFVARELPLAAVALGVAGRVAPRRSGACRDHGARRRMGGARRRGRRRARRAAVLAARGHAGAAAPPSGSSDRPSCFSASRTRR